MTTTESATFRRTGAPALPSLVLSGLVLLAFGLQAQVPDAADQTVRAALAGGKVQVEFVDTPIESVLAFLQDSSKVPIVLDPQAGGDYVSVTLSDASIQEALGMILELIDHDFEVRDGVVFVSTRSRIRRSQSVARFYDCRDLLSPVEDFPARNFQVNHFDDSMGGAVFGGDEAADLLDGDMLLELIFGQVAPERWEDDARADMLPGMLVVSGTPELQAGVESLLASLREHMGAQLAIDVVALALSREQAAATLGDTAMTGVEASVPCSADMLTALHSGGRSIGHVSLVGFNSQRVSAASGLVRSRVLDYDVEIASSSVAMDPVIGSDTAGISVDVRPILDADGKHVILDLIVELSAFRGADRRVKASAASVRATAGMGDISSTTTATVGMGGEIQVREVARDHVASRLQLTLGQTTAMVRSSRLVESDEVEVLLLLVRRID